VTYPARNLIELSDAEATAAVSIALEDPLVQEIVAGKQYTTTAGLWHTSDERLIGAVINLKADRVGTYDFDWPAVDWDENDSPIYPATTLHGIVTGTEFVLLVDLMTQDVAELSPGTEATVEWDADWEAMTPAAGGD
jgi:hypothetical protein